MGIEQVKFGRLLNSEEAKVLPDAEGTMFVVVNNEPVAHMYKVSGMDHLGTVCSMDSHYVNTH